MAKSEVQGMNEVHLCHAEVCRLLTEAVNSDRMSSAYVKVTDFKTEVKDHCKHLVIAYKAKGGDESQP